MMGINTRSIAEIRKEKSMWQCEEQRVLKQLKAQPENQPRLNSQLESIRANLRTLNAEYHRAMVLQATAEKQANSKCSQPDAVCHPSLMVSRKSQATNSPQ